MTLSRYYEDMAKQCNLDIALLTFQNFLSKVHSNFFDDFENKKKGLHEGKETDIKSYIHESKRSVFDKDLKINFRYFVKWDLKDSKAPALMPKFEKHLCDKFGIKYVEKYNREGP